MRCTHVILPLAPFPLPLHSAMAKSSALLLAAGLLLLCAAGAAGRRTLLQASLEARCCTCCPGLGRYWHRCALHCAARVWRESWIVPRCSSVAEGNRQQAAAAASDGWMPL